MTTEDKLSAGPILGAVGGFVVLAVGGFEVCEALQVGAGNSIRGVPGEGGLVAGGLLGVVIGLVMMLVAFLLWSRPDLHVGLGAARIVPSQISLLSLEGGLGLGVLLGVLGGTCGIVYGPGSAIGEDPRQASRARASFAAGSGSASPDPVGGTPAPGAPVSVGGRTHQACVRCGQVSPIGHSFCPSCGAPFEGPPPAPIAPS